MIMEKDRMWFSNPDTMAEILKAYLFTAQKFVEEDGSVTLSLNEIDLVENGSNEASAKLALGKAILCQDGKNQNVFVNE